MKVRIFQDFEALSIAATKHIAQASADAIQRRGVFSIAMAGGSTPQRTYTLLAKKRYTSMLDWERVHIFLGDERCVPQDNPLSNFHMLKKNLLSYAAIPESNIHPAPCDLSPSQAAQAYEETLRAYFQQYAKTAPATFDLVLLGLGEDGHTASIFPASPAMQEQKRWVVPVKHTTPPEPIVDRITLTPLAINAAAQVLFLVSGEKKSERVAQILEGKNSSTKTLPAGLIQPTTGELFWFLDKEGASSLRSDRFIPR